jgi:undecaprenyl-diphosphatase
MKNRKNIILICIICVSLLLFGYMAYNIKVGNSLAIDWDVYNYVVFHLRFNWVTNVLKVITFLGSKGFYIPVVLVALLFMKDKKIAMAQIVNVGISACVMKVIKTIVKRPRPSMYNLITETGFSFPSGHALNAVTFYGFIIYVIYKKVENKPLRNSLIALLSILVIGIGYSRIYLGVHFTTDVLCGYLVGLVDIIVYIKFIYKRFFAGKHENKKA